MSPARGILVGFAIVAGLTARAAPAARPFAQVPPRVSGFDQTQTWLRIARTHTIGTVDDAARTVASWSPAALQQVLDDAQLIRLLVVTAARQGRTGGGQGPKTWVEFRGRRLTLQQLSPLLGFQPGDPDGALDPAALAAPDGAAERAIARIMIQAAMLHTDIVMASAADLPPPAPSRSPTTVIQLRDGRESVVSNPAVHYAIAREAIGLVLPTTAGTMVARKWYTATLAYLQGERNYAALLPQLETARVTMPADPWVWMMSGVAYENLAAPAVQSATASSGSGARLEAPMILFARSEQLFRHTLMLDPLRTEARLRLGRVLDLTGRHEEAAEMLALAEKGLTSDLLRYYAALFVGRAAESSGKTDDARRAYERAMTLFPQAQSPRLALAELAWRDADHTLALSGMHTLFITAHGDRSTDPWWIYDVSLVLDWAQLVTDMRQAAAGMAR